MSPAMRRTESLGLAQDSRMAVAEIKGRVQGDPLAVAEILADPPEVLRNFLVVEVLAMFRRSGLRAVSIEDAGRHAAVDRVNLLVPMGRASRGTRAWAIRNGLRYGVAAVKGALVRVADELDSRPVVTPPVLGTDLRHVTARVDIDELGRPVLVLHRGGFDPLTVELTVTPDGALALAEDLRRAVLGGQA